MKSKYNPFRSTVTRGATMVFACFTVLHTSAHAATIDTTSTTIDNTAPLNILDTTWIGNGTLNFNGSGTIGLDNSGGGHPDFFNMTGGSITVQSGVTLQNGGWQGGVWTNNLASLDLASGATLDLWDGNPVRVDALTGAGTVTISSAPGVNWAGSRSLVLGVNGGGGIFTGNIAGNSAVNGGSVSLTKEGAGTQTLTGLNTYNGTTVVNGGALRFTDTAPNSSASLSIASGASLDFNVSTAPATYDGTHVQLGAFGGTTVTGTGTFVKSGAGVLALDGQGGNHAVTFNMTGGLIDIQVGTLRNGGWDGGIWGGNLASMNVATGALFDIWGGQSVVVDALTGGGTIDASLYGSNQTLTVGANNGSGTFSGVFQNTTGSLGLIKTGSGTQILTGANTYTGNTNVNQGTLEVTNIGAYVSGTTTIAVNSTFSANLSVDQTVSGNIIFTGSGTLLKNGPGTWVVGANGPSVSFNMSAGGLVDIEGGTIQNNYTHSSWGANLASVKIASGATLDLFAEDGQMDALSGGGTLQNSYTYGGVKTVTIGVSNGSGTFAGVISGAGGNLVVVKTGTGTQTLSGANTYGGQTDIQQGTLRIQNSSGLGVGGFNGATMTFVRDGATLELDGNLSIGEHMHLSGAGVGGNGALRVLSGNSTFTTDIAFINTATINVAGGASLTQSAQFYYVGGLTKTGNGTLTLSNANGYTGATTVNAGTLDLTYSGDNNGGVGTLATGSNITVNSGGTLLANAFNALGYQNHSGDTLQVNEGGTLMVGVGQVVSMPYNLNVVGGSLTSADPGYPGFGTFYLGGGTHTFTSSAGGTASLISAQNVNLAAPTVAFTVNAGSGAVDLNVTGTLIGTGGLQKDGGGTMVLSGANTYSGGTTINAGTLQIGNGGSTGSYGTGPVTNNATLVWNNTSGLDVASGSNAISGTGAFTIKAGVVRIVYDNGGSVSNGTITVDGTGSSNSSSFIIWAGNGATIANNFVLNSMGPAQNRGAINQDGGAGLVTLNGSITLAGDSRIGVGGGSWNSMVINGQVTGGGKLFVYESPFASPSTQLTLTSGANNYSGGTEIEQGRLTIANAAALGTGAVTITGENSQLLVDGVGGTIANNFTLGGGGNPGSTNYGYGNATMVFHNDGQTATFSGTITLSSDAKLRGYSGGGTTNFSNPIVGTGNLTFEAGGAAPGHTQYWGLGGSVSTFTGNVLVRGDGSANSYLRLNGGALPSGTVLTLEDQSFLGGNNAVFDLNGNSQTLAGLSRVAGAGGLGSFVTNSGGSQSTLTINGSANSSFSGVIGVNTAGVALGQSAGGDNIALVKSGSGTFTLSGANTYTGATTVTAGKLVVTDTIGSSAVTVSGSGAILATDTAATIGSTLAINSGAILAVGDAANASTATATVNGATTFNNGSIFSWDIDAAGTSYDKLITTSVAGEVTPGDAVFRIVASDALVTAEFWNTPKTWNNIFSTDGTDGNAIAGWATIFGNTVSVVDSSFTSITPVGGSFSLSGSTLTWTAVPEPTTALAGLLLGAGLLRRRRNVGF